MQQVGDPTTASGERGPVSPFKAFVVLGAVVAATIAAVIATRPDPIAPAPQRPTTAAIPTETEAIAIFNELHDLWLRSYQERDATLIKLFIAPDASSPLDDISEEIRNLKDEGVLFQTRYERISTDISHRSADEVRIVEQTVRTPRFVDETTLDEITQNPVRERLTVVWTMRRYGTGWRIYESEITDAETT